MEWLTSLNEQTVGLDTAVFIYAIEGNSTYLPLVRPLFDAIDQGVIQAVTSTITLLEVLVHPFRQGNQSLVSQYEDILLNARGLTTLAIIPAIATRAAKLRSAYNLRTPDAIQMATALHAGATHFITNDLGLPVLPELNILVLKNLDN